MEAVKVKTVSWAKTRRGGATLVAVALAAFKAIVDSGSLSAFPMTLAIYAVIGTVLVHGAAWLWVSRTEPATPRFARPRGFSTQNKRLREDGNARLQND